MYESVYLCIYVSMYLSMDLSMDLCIYLCIYVCIYLSMYLCIYVSMYPSKYQPSITQKRSASSSWRFQFCRASLVFSLQTVRECMGWQIPLFWFERLLFYYIYYIYIYILIILFYMWTYLREASTAPRCSSFSQSSSCILASAEYWTTDTRHEVMWG